MRHVPGFLHIRSAWAATIWYSVLTGTLTWPLVTGLGRDLPRDLGDPLLNTWILAWGAHRLWAAATGHLAALDGFWSANIFYPEPLTLAYSEALIPQVLQILPVYGLTKNAILCHNLIFFSTFVLSGLGVYLLVRELTRDARGAFVGGLLYAFALYRVCQFPHVQVLSSQWMPFALFGFRRYFESGRVRTLAGAGAALWAQNLSCGYYLFFFAPLVALYLAWELVDRGRWRDRRTLWEIGITLAATVAATLVFLMPYLSVRIARPLNEIVFYSADVYSYLSTTEFIRLWGSVIQAFPKPEGELFPGVVPPVLALVAVAVWAWETWHHAGEVTRRSLPEPWWRRGIAWLAAALVVAYAAALVVILLRGPTVFWLAGVRVSVRSIVRPLQALPVALGVLLAASPRARALVRGVPGSSVGFFSLALAAAFLFSLGPQLKTLGQSIGTGPYAWLLAIEPGIDSVRVPARFAMLVALFLAVLGGIGAGALVRRRRRTGAILVAAASIAFLVEGSSVPIALNVRGYAEGLRLPEPGPIRQGDQAPPVYRAVAALPEGSAIVEFPFGAFAYEFRYMFYSTLHWKPILNGYSGFFPPSYEQRRAVFARVSRDPDRAWRVLAESGATHAIVHETFYADREATLTVQWLEQRGARLLGTFEYDRLYELPGKIESKRERSSLATPIAQGGTEAMRRDPLGYLSLELDALREQKLYRSLRVLDGEQRARSTFDGRSVVNLSSNNYLGLATHPRLRAAALEAVRQLGVGSGAVRTIAGTMAIHMELERRLADFKQVEAVVVFQSGFAANAGTVAAILTKDDVIISDELNHASIIDGCRLSRAAIRVFPHKDVAAARKILEELPDDQRKLLITDGVFSMDGDLGALPALCDLAEEFGCIMMVDDAHASGVFGRNGRGTIDHFGVHGRVDIQVGTLSKAMGALGGYVAGSRALIEYLYHRARPFLFSTSHPPSVAATCLAAIDVLLEEPALIERLWDNTRFFKAGLQSLGFDTGISESPITPVIAGDGAKAMELSDRLFKQGVFAQGIAFPTVPRDRARVRTIVTAEHTPDQLQFALDAFAKVGRDIGLI